MRIRPDRLVVPWVVPWLLTGTSGDSSSDAPVVYCAILAADPLGGSAATQETPR